MSSPRRMTDRMIRRGIVTYISALLLMAAFAAAAYFPSSLILHRREQTARVVEASHLQDTWTQRAAFLSLQLAGHPAPEAPSFAFYTETRNALIATIGSLRSTQEALAYGSPEMGLPAPSAALRQVYFGSRWDLDRRMREFLGHAESILSRPQAVLRMDDPDLVAVLTSARGPLFDSLQAASSTAESECRAALTSLRRMLLWSTLIFLLVILGEGLFLYRPLFQKLGLLQEELHEAGRTDPLTGCLNRRAFAEEAKRLLARSRRYGSMVAVLMIDADRFKQINDGFGHDTGDVVICRLAEVLMNSVREIDVVGRMGGEEFAILMGESGLVAAMLVAQRIRKAVAAVRVNPRTRVGAPISVTVSIGVALLRKCDSSLFDALDRADQALYLAKKNGRNRVECEIDVPEAEEQLSPALGTPVRL